MPFSPYIARDRHFDDYRFDFHIVNETAQSWYDGSPDQRMPEREWCLAQLKPGMTVVDCGAHHGMMSVLFAQVVGPEGAVIAYEALPSNASVIEQNATLNGLGCIEVRPVGVGDANSLVKIDFNSSNTVILADTANPAAAEGNAIQIVRLDDDFPPERRVDFIKIDVEGHDLQALRGMTRILEQRPIIDLELHNFIFADRNGTLSQILSILDGLGYRWKMLGEIADAPIDLGTHLDIESIAVFDNPHLFGIPISRS